jgi:hypothetical protein
VSREALVAAIAGLQCEGSFLEEGGEGGCVDACALCAVAQRAKDSLCNALRFVKNTAQVEIVRPDYTGRRYGAQERFALEIRTGSDGLLAAQLMA